MILEIGQKVNFLGELPNYLKTHELRVAVLHPGYEDNPESYFPRTAGEVELTPGDMVDVQCFNEESGEWGWSTTGVKASEISI